MKIRRFSLAFSWPTYSPKVLGRRVFSASLSSRVYSAVTMRFSKSLSLSNIPIAAYTPLERRFSAPLISPSTGSAGSSLAMAAAASVWL